MKKFLWVSGVLLLSSLQAYAGGGAQNACETPGTYSAGARDGVGDIPSDVAPSRKSDADDQGPQVTQYSYSISSLNVNGNKVTGTVTQIISTTQWSRTSTPCNFSVEVGANATCYGKSVSVAKGEQREVGEDGVQGYAQTWRVNFNNGLVTAAVDQYVVQNVDTSRP